MDRSYASGAVGSAPPAPASPSIGYPTAGNPGTGTPATKPGPYWYHQITEELLAIITSAGIAPAQGTLTQLASAIQSGKLFSSAAGGTANALTASFVPAVDSLVNGMSFYVRAASANATTTPTFTPNSGTIAAKAIVKGAGAALAAGDIAGGGHWVELQYDQTLDKWVLLNPATGVTAASAASIQGAFKNLQASSTGLNANVSVTADEIAVESAANAYQTLRSVNLTIAGTSSGVANGLDTGAIAASTWYSIWVIWNGTTTAGLLSLSSTAPTLPSGYTHKARVGWIRTDGTGNKYPLAFKQLGRDVQYVVGGGNMAALPIMSSGAQGAPATPTWVALATGNFVPPTASEITTVIAIPGGGSINAIMAPNNSYGGYNSTTNAPPFVNCTSYVSVDQCTLLLESANIYYAAGGGQVYAKGWRDNL